MSEATILENNKLIAEFMGGKNTARGYFIPYWCLVNMDSIELGKGKITEYHKSYDWLMPVVEKIESLKSPDGQCAGNYFCMILGNGISIELPNKEKDILICSTEQKKLTKIEAVYLGVVKFIKWYNKNEKK
jgi:hypothetical protein